MKPRACPAAQSPERTLGPIQWGVVTEDRAMKASLNRRATAVHSLTAAALTLFVSCGSDEPPCVDGDSRCGAPCDRDAPCAAGLYCGGGACAKECIAGSTEGCGEGESCTFEGRCSSDEFGNASMRPDGPGSPSGSGDDGGPGGPLTPENACGLDLSWAQLQPVDMLVMFDRSGSMLDDDKWPNATAALNAFFGDAAAAELRIALRLFPHDDPESGCNDDDCDADACAQPLVELAALSAEPAPADAHEAALHDAIEEAMPSDGSGQGTPIFAALDGALRWAIDEQAARPDENVVVVFVTDGEPNGCEEDFDAISELAEDALADEGIRTYAIGLEGSSEDEMDQLAEAGGTEDGIFIDDSSMAEQQLLEALNTIRGQNLGCDFPVPEPLRMEQSVDLDNVSVTFVYGSGAPPTSIARVADEDECGGSLSWYYDDPGSPERIFLCTGACDRARAAQDGGLQVLIGCDTPETLECAENPEAPECVVE
jgi:hypothetical protein